MNSLRMPLGSKHFHPPFPLSYLCQTAWKFFSVCFSFLWETSCGTRPLSDMKPFNTIKSFPSTYGVPESPPYVRTLSGPSFSLASLPFTAASSCMSVLSCSPPRLLKLPRKVTMMPNCLTQWPRLVHNWHLFEPADLPPNPLEVGSMTLRFPSTLSFGFAHLGQWHCPHLLV